MKTMNAKNVPSTPIKLALVHLPTHPYHFTSYRRNITYTLIWI